MDGSESFVEPQIEAQETAHPGEDIGGGLPVIEY